MSFIPTSEIRQPRQTIKKAPLGRRLGAFILDTALALFPLIFFASFLLYPLIAMTLYWPLPSMYRHQPIYYVIAALSGISFIWFIFYSLCRDGLNGQSFGKRLFGLMVVRYDDLQPATTQDSALRNLPLFLIAVFHWVLPIIGFLFFLIEPIAILRSHSGLRLGDCWAQTRVIDQRSKPSS